MDALLSPLTAAWIRLLAMMATALLALSITLLGWLPYSMVAAGSVFDGLTYLLCYLLFMGMALPLSLIHIYFRRPAGHL